MTYIYNTFFNNVAKRLYLRRHVRWSGIPKACFGQSSKQGDCMVCQLLWSLMGEEKKHSHTMDY